MATKRKTTDRKTTAETGGDDYPLELRLLFPAKAPHFTGMTQRGDVMEWQRFLAAQGFGSISQADGIYGRATNAQTRAFQKKHGLLADGIAGEQTYAVARTLGYHRPVAAMETIVRPCNDRRDYPMVAKWNYVVSKRLRLAGQMADEDSEELETLIAEFLQPALKKMRDPEKRMAERRAFIAKLAEAEFIEVGMKFTSEETGWAARLFPWENALSIVTRRLRKRPLVITRHLDARSDSVRNPGNEPRTLIVRSTPGEFREKYDFRSEAQLVRYKLGHGPDSAACTEIDTPTREALEAKVREAQPEILHLAVLDIHAVRALKPDASSPEGEGDDVVRDGILLAGLDSAFSAVDAAECGRLVNRADKKPVLVAFATCYSATRLAPLAVAGGTHIAIGFQDELFNSASEAFFGVFYETWRETKWDTLEAFRKALAVLRGMPESGRSGVALWSSSSLLKARFDADSRSAIVPATRATASASTVKAEAARIDAGALHEALSVHCKPFETVNYCSLHNGRELFSRFIVQKKQPGIVPPIEVTVELTAETESALWRHNVTFTDAPGSEDLVQKVRVPLGARSLRRVQESTRTSLFVEARCGGVVLLRQTTPVTLLPVDEWRDTEEDRRWLPSFVLPRDPAIRRIMAAADRYLRALCDDSGAGFDGYQRADRWPDVVDIQARAIWCALMFDLQLRYINPPPTYTRTERGVSQRLRTPGQIISEGRGTCIDLALLFASCLEYIGVYPVIFLIAGHAFPGWWRSERAYSGFLGFRYLPDIATSGIGKDAPSIAKDDFAGWMVTGENGFREIVPALREGTLAALETTDLCSGGAFEDALSHGRENLADPAIFDALVNIQRAREGKNPVTPLPIVGDIAMEEKL